MTEPDYDKLIRLHIKTIEARLDGMDKLLQVRGIELDRRLAGLNELRADVVKDRDQFVRRESYELKMIDLEKLGNRVTSVETRLVVWSAVLAFIFTVVNIVLRLWK